MHLGLAQTPVPRVSEGTAELPAHSQDARAEDVAEPAGCWASGSGHWPLRVSQSVRWMAPCPSVGPLASQRAALVFPAPGVQVEMEALLTDPPVSWSSRTFPASARAMCSASRRPLGPGYTGAVGTVHGSPLRWAQVGGQELEGQRPARPSPPRPPSS